MKKMVSISLTVLGLTAFALGSASTAAAKSTDVRASGTCTGASTSKIKLGREDGKIEVEFEVDQNRNGVLWNVGLWHNDIRVFTGTRRTAPPSGSFEVRRLIPNRAGADRVVGRATNPASGERCRAAATI